LVGLGIFGFIARKIYKRVHTRKKTVFFGGDVLSGKSVLRVRLMKPNVSNEDLLKWEQSRGVTIAKIIRDYSDTKITLEAKLFDAAGNEPHRIIDQLNKLTIELEWRR
jgi:hypothetical protein